MSESTAYVLSTRELPATIVAEAAAKGVIIDVLPFIGVTGMQDEQLRVRLLELSKHSLTAVFTSANAVTAVGPQSAPDWKIFCIGGATRRAVTHSFDTPVIAGTADSAKELAEIIIRKVPGKEVWFFCGDRRRDELPAILRMAGVRVHELVVYRTVLTPHRIEKRYDAIAFFSPSAVESFFSVNTVEPHVPLFAIGKTTAAAVQKQCPNPVSVSETPDEKILIEQIIKNSQH